MASNPLAPGWFQGPGTNKRGAINGVAAITAASAVMCVPSSETAPAVGQEVVFPYLASLHRNRLLDGRYLFGGSHGAHPFGSSSCRIDER